MEAGWIWRVINDETGEVILADISETATAQDEEIANKTAKAVQDLFSRQMRAAFREDATVMRQAIDARLSESSAHALTRQIVRSVATPEPKP